MDYSLEQHLKSRDLDISLYSSMYLDINEDLLWIPLWNLSGQLVGYQTYRPNASKSDKTIKPKYQKYFNYLSKVNRKVQLSAFGLDLLNLNKRTLFLVEGVFDAIPFHNLGLNCLGLLGVQSKANKQLLGNLKSLGYHLIAICEDDVAGKNLSKYADTSLYLTGGKDPGDLKTEGVKEFLVNNNIELN